MKYLDKIGRKINPFKHINRMFFLSEWQPLIIRIRAADELRGPYDRYSYVVLPQ